MTIWPVIREFLVDIQVPDTGNETWTVVSGACDAPRDPNQGFAAVPDLEPAPNWRSQDLEKRPGGGLMTLQ